MPDAISVNLPTILDSFKSHWYMTADAHEVDGLGHLELSDAGMLARDTAVLREWRSERSGGHGHRRRLRSGWAAGGSHARSSSTRR